MVLDVQTYEIAVLIGTLTGIAVRTGFYFYAKQKEDLALGDQVRTFAARYLVSGGLAAALIITGGFMAYPIVAEAVPNTGSLIGVLAGSFVASIGLNELFNKVLSSMGLTPQQVQQAAMKSKVA